MKKRLFAAWSYARRPLTISAISSSVGGAAATLLAAHELPVEEFTKFSLIYLAVTTASGLVRGALLQPALIRFRTDKRPILSPIQALTSTALCTVAIGIVVFLIVGGDPSGAILIAGASAILLLQDWLRHRSLAAHQWTRIAVCDLVRVGLIPTLLISPPTTGSEYSSRFLMLYGSSFFVLLLGYQRSRTYLPYRDFARDGRAQGIDFALASLNGTLPMLIIGAVTAIPLIGAIRLAQTLLGPLNLLFVAVELNLLASASTTSDLAENRTLILKGKAIARRVLTLSLLFVGTALIVAAVIPAGIVKIESDILILGIALAGANQLTSGWAGIHIVVLRALGKSLAVARARVAVVFIIVLAYLAAYVTWGAANSLISGLIMSAITFPLLFGLAARRVYRTEFVAPD